MCYQSDQLVIQHLSQLSFTLAYVKNPIPYVGTSFLKLKDVSIPDMLFNQISCYWAEIADAHLTSEQVDFLKNSLDSKGLVLDLGCGHGRHSILLSKAGYLMVGLDISRQLLNVAKNRADAANVDLSLVLADMRSLPFKQGVLSAVISLDSSFGYLRSEDEDLKSFREISRILTNNGTFLIDLFNKGHLIRRQSNRISFVVASNFLKSHSSLAKIFAGLFKWREYPSFCLYEKSRVNSKRQLLQLFWVFKDKKAGKISTVNHIVRLYNFPQLQMLLRKAGLKVTKVCGNYDGERYTEGAKRLILRVSNAAE